MGFSSFEKNKFRSSMRSNDKIQEILETEYPDDIISYLQSEGLMRQVRDYYIIPERLRPNKPENLVITYLLSPEKTVYDILKDWQSFLSPSVCLNR